MGTIRPLRRTSWRSVTIAALLAVAVQAMPARAGTSGAWERIAPPAQGGGSAAYANTTNLFYVFGGDGTNILHAATPGNPPTDWINVRTTGTPPPARTACGLVFDPTDNRLLVFGGLDLSEQALGDLWQLSLDGEPAWSQLDTGGEGPSPRADAGVCFDDDRGILVVFGGRDGLGDLVDGDLHQIDLRQPEPQWSRWEPAGSAPMPRSGLVLCDVPVIDGLVVFGGNDDYGNLADAYRMSYGSHEWSVIAGTGDTPLPVSNALGVYDEADHVLLVWGGNGSDGEVRSLSLSTEIWTVEPNTNWQPAPEGHTHPIGAWTGGNSQMLVLDGENNSQMYEFHYFPDDGSYWQDWRDPGAAGEIRYGAAFVYNREDDVALLTNGSNSYEQPVQSTWSYSFSGQKGWCNTFFNSLCGNETPALTRHVAVWDPLRRRMLVFGGMDAGYNRRNSVYAMEYMPGGYNCWSEIATIGTPPTGRYGTAAVYDPVGDRLLVFGGSDVSGYPRDDLWQLSLAGVPTWSEITATGGPGAREDHTAIYDAAHRRMIVFGGTNSFAGHPGDEAWALNLPALTWTLLQPTGPTPPVHARHTAVYDSRRVRMLVFGGDVSWGADARETWELDLAVNPPEWTLLEPALSPQWLPSLRSLHAAVYDSTGDRMLVYGGLLPPLGPVGNPYPLRDLWSLQFDFTGGATAVTSPRSAIAFTVGEPTPNPSGGATRFVYSLPSAARVRAAIYDVAGRRVTRLADGDHSAGDHELRWNGHDDAGRPAAPGLYFLRIDVDGQALTRKVVLVH
jgi:hypothetical protein